jgi:hypothetical protein
LDSKTPTVTEQNSNVALDKNAAESAAHKFAAEANSKPARSKSFLEEGIAYATSKLTRNPNTQNEVAKYGAEVIATAALVMPGRTGLIATTIFSALNQAHTGESNSAEATDLVLGAISGATTRGAYRLLGNSEGLGSPATAGFAFSLVNRSTSALFDKSNYIEPNGQVNLTAGFGKAMSSVLDVNAVKADAMIFGGSLYASKLAEGISPIMKSASIRRVTAGTVFGAINGVNQELTAEKGKDNLDYMAIAKAGALHGAINGLAFGIGGIRDAGGPGSDSKADSEARLKQSTAAEHGARISLGTRLERFRRVVEADFLRHPTEEPPRKVLGNELPSELEGPTSEKHPNQLGFVAGTESLEYRTEQEGPFDDYTDFIARGIVKQPTPVRTYQAGEGSVPIVVAEDYAKDLDARQDKNSGLTPERQMELQQRVGPSDVTEALMSLPDRSYFKKVIISDKPNPDDDWVTQDYKEGKEPFVSSMGVLRGEVVLYKKNKDVYFAGDLKHEWSHELHDRHYDEPLAWGFGYAVDMERNKWSAREYMQRSKKDQFAVMGERLIGTDETEFLEATEKAPLRTVFYMKALEKALAQVAPENRSVAHDEYARRVEYVKANVIPKAVQKLDDILASEDQYDQQKARNILYNLRMEDMIPKAPPEEPIADSPATTAITTVSTINPATIEQAAVADRPLQLAGH